MQFNEIDVYILSYIYVNLNANRIAICCLIYKNKEACINIVKFNSDKKDMDDIEIFLA